MADTEVPTLEVGFAINFQDSFGQLRSLDDVVGDVAANVFREFQRVEQATKGAINMGSATAQVTSFGNAMSREMQNATRDTNRAEKAAEAMVRQINRQAEVFGKSASEIRQMRAEMRALDAEQRGLTELAGRLRAASAEMNRLEASTVGVGVASRRNSHSMIQFGMQMNDIGTMAMLGAPPMQIFASQIGQIVQVTQMAEGGVKGFAAQLGGLLLQYAPLIGAAGAAVLAFGLFNRAMSQGIDTQPMIDGLGLTRAEIKKLKDTSISTGDVVTATFQVIAERVGLSLTDMTKWFGQALDWMTTAGRNTLAALYSQFVGTFRAIGAIVQGVFSGKGIGEILSDVGDSYKGAFNEANKAMTQFGQDVRKQIAGNKLEGLRKQAAELKADRTPKTNRRAEQAAREAQAVEAQIRGLYRLADAYGVSGAAALIAEAHVKAETAAIKRRIDMDAAIDRQVRLSIAQRVSDASKAVAAAHDQAVAQERVNAMVAGGLVPAERAADLVRERIDELPLLAAVEAAQQRGLKAEAERATSALAAQRKEYERLRIAGLNAQVNSSLASGQNRLDELREELRLIGATDEARARAIATFKANQESKAWTGLSPEAMARYVALQGDIAEQTIINTQAQNAYNEKLTFSADRWELIARNVENAARGMADAFGNVGQAIGDMAAIYANFHADQERLVQEHSARIAAVGKDEAAINAVNAKFALASATSQIGLYGDMTDAAKGFFKERSSGYKALETAEKAFRAIEFALSVRAMAQDASETASSIANSGARIAKDAVAAVVKAISELPWPLNLAAGAATIAALASIGVGIAGSFGGGGNTLTKANDGTGTVFGDSAAKSESIKRAIDSLKEVDTLTNSYAREMAASLRSIESQIGGFASLLVRAGNINASDGVNTGFKTDTTGKLLSGILTGGGLLSKVPILGGLLGAIGGVVKSLFGTKTSVIGSGLYGDAQSLEDILGGGFDASYYSDIKKKKKFFGLTTSTKYSTQFSAADPALENQFTLILREFNNAIAAAAGPLGVATDDIQARLNGFVVSIGKIDLQGLTGEEIEEKLTAVFGAAADKMANAAFPGMERFQQVGEGAFDTLVRVASVVEAVTTSFDMLGFAANGLSIDMKMALSEQFDSVSAMTSAVDSYFEAYYTPAEQAAAKTAQFGKVFDSLDLAMPSTLASFRALVEAQNLTTAAGQATYATLLQLAPAFADLQASMSGAKSAADILNERQDLERKLLELQGDTAAIRALDLAQLDASNRALQEQIYALQDAKEAAAAADQLRDAWTSVGDSIMDEVKRIRGLTGGSDTGSFAMLMGQFNAANTAARGGDLDAAKTLPGLSQSLLNAAALMATSRQELNRVQAQTAASLEATYAAVNAITGGTGTASATDVNSLLAAAAASQAATNQTPASDDLVAEVKALRDEVAQLRSDNNAGHAANAGNTGAIKRHLDNVTSASGGDAIATVVAA